RVTAIVQNHLAELLVWTVEAEGHGVGTQQAPLLRHQILLPRESQFAVPARGAHPCPVSDIDSVVRRRTDSSILIERCRRDASITRQRLKARGIRQHRCDTNDGNDCQKEPFNSPHAALSTPLLNALT